jgi:PleD family two-component response regulator
MSISPQAPHRHIAPLPQKVVVVNGTSEILEMFESVLDAGRYDMVFVESSAHAYTRIKGVQPNLVILCMRLDDADAFHLLSMLKLDDETRKIPIVTYAQEFDSTSEEEEPTEEENDAEFPMLRPAVTMN